MWSDLIPSGITPGGGDEWVSYGTLKDFVDGSMMFAPMANTPDYTGGPTFRFVDEATTRRNIVSF